MQNKLDCLSLVTFLIKIQTPTHRDTERHQKLLHLGKVQLYSKMLGYFKIELGMGKQSSLFCHTVSDKDIS